MFDGLRKTLARHFFRRIKIYRPDVAFITELPATHSLRRKIETHKFESSIKIDVLTLPDVLKNLRCTVKKVKFTLNKITVKKFKIKRYTRQDIRVNKLPKRGMNTYSALKQIQSLPQERENILKLLRNKPAIAKNEMLLACYGPIVDSAVIKLALNKSKGTLLIWYNAGSRQLKARYVYLVRRLGLGEKPEWRWV